MSRVLSISNLYDKKYENIPLSGVWADAFGKQEYGGAWLIYGSEKNGKSSFALMLANYLSKIGSTLYVSAEEGTIETFKDACMRAGIERSNQNLKVLEYYPLEALKKDHFEKRRKPRFVFIDNLTVYKGEITDEVIFSLTKEYPDITIIYIAHEEDNEPYMAVGKACKRFARVIVRVIGLTAFFSGRLGSKGGEFVIDTEKAALIHGDKINNKNNTENENND